MANKREYPFIRHYKVLRRYPRFPEKGEEGRQTLVGIIQVFYPPSSGNVVRFHGRYISGHNTDTLYEIAKPLYEKSQQAMSGIDISTQGEQLLYNLSTLDDLYWERQRLILGIVNTETRTSTPDSPWVSRTISSKRERLPGLEGEIVRSREKFERTFDATTLSATEREKIQHAYREILRLYT